MQGRCIFNIRDFTMLAGQYPQHAGVILAAQTRWTVADLCSALDRVLSETEGDEWIGRVRWLNQWRC